MPGPNLSELPSMDDIKIGPGGQTFGQLKQEVIDCRQAYINCRNDNPHLPEYGDALGDAIKMLKAAYIRVGLPYVTP